MNRSTAKRTAQRHTMGHVKYVRCVFILRCHTCKQYFWGEEGGFLRVCCYHIWLFGGVSECKQPSLGWAWWFRTCEGCNKHVYYKYRDIWGSGLHRWMTQNLPHLSVHSVPPPRHRHRGQKQHLVQGETGCLDLVTVCQHLLPVLMSSTTVCQAIDGFANWQ